MCKEITPTFLMAAVITYRLLNRDIKKLAIDACMIIAGILIFWSIWAVYCVLSHTDIMAFIRYTTMSKGKKVTIEFLLKITFRGQVCIIQSPVKPVHSVTISFSDEYTLSASASICLPSPLGTT